LILGVAAADADHKGVLIAGVAGLVAGAMSMAAGEYVSVHSQADTEIADLEKEKQELATEPEAELRELTGIYMHRGLDADLARKVAEQLTAKDALAAHARDELGISEAFSARPVQAALSSAASFSVGAALPLAVAWLIPGDLMIWTVAGSTAFFLALLGGVAAHTGGADVVKGASRVLIWGVLAMAATYLVGSLFGVASA
jgi:VIT1/CCC1 family predicted Fe2+/Mn2+ transporter